ncbi:MAG: hypothetical protein ACP5NZ_00365 [Nanobdellota archaeon]
MKKTLLTLAFMGMVGTGCSEKGDIFKEISKEKTFKLKEYKEYILDVFLDEREDLLFVNYDFNQNGKMDAMAVTRMIPDSEGKYAPSPYAFNLTLDKDEDGICEKFYLDRNFDGKFDDIVKNREKRETTEDKSELFL